MKDKFEILNSKFKTRLGKRLSLLVLVLLAEIGVLGWQSVSGFPVVGRPERVFVGADGEFLFQTINSSPFRVLIGDRADPANHRLRLERAGGALELSLQRDPLEKQTLPEPPPNLPDHPDSTSSARLEKLRAEAEAKLAQEREQISSEAGQLLGQIETQVADITQDLGSISAGLESVQTQSAQIEAEVKSLVGQTFLTIEEGEEVIRTSEVLPGLDTSQQVIGAGVRQNFIFKTPPQESNFRFSLTLEGLRANQDQNGHWQFLNSSGHPLLSLAPPLLEDAAGQQGAATLEILPPATAHQSPITNHQLTRRSLGEGGSLFISLDPAWLSSPDRVFPVTLEWNILVIPTPEELGVATSGGFNQAFLSTADAFNPDRNPGHACQIIPFSSRLSPGEQTTLKVNFSPSDPQLAFGFKVGSLPQDITASFGTIDQSSLTIPLNIVVASNPQRGSLSLVVAYLEELDSTTVAKTICQFNLVIE